MSRAVVGVARAEFPDSELSTALWLLRECRDDERRMDALFEAGGDIAALVIAVEDRVRRLAEDRSD